MSSVDPRKYIKMIDWEKLSKDRYPGKMTRTKRISIIAELIEAKKKIPGPTDYKTLS